MTYLGIDLHSNSFICCFINDDGKKKKMGFDLNASSLEYFYSLLNLDTYVLIEASTNTFKFVELIKDKVKEVSVANTHKLKLISLVNKKTDKIDAEKLAIFLKMQKTSKEELISPVYIPENTIQELRGLFTSYNLLKKQIGQTKNRIHAIYKQNLKPFTKEYIFGKNKINEIRKISLGNSFDIQIDILFRSLTNLQNLQLEIEKQILIIGSKYYEQIDILTSMRGISVLTAIALISDIATVDRFPNSKHFTSYLRSAPGVDSSNNETYNKKTNKFGRKLSVTLLSQSLNHFRDSNLKLNRWYDKKVNIQGNKKGKIRMAICRKVFAEIYQMLKKKEYHYFTDEENHNKKMREYNTFLEKNKIFKKSA